MKIISIYEKLISLARQILLIAIGIYLILIIIISVVNANYGFNKIKKTIRKSLIRKGVVLTSNNSISLRSMVEDNAFLAIRELVVSTVKEDGDVVYGIFMDNERRPWVSISPKNQDGIIEKPILLDDSISLWADTVQHLSFIEIKTDSVEIFEFASPVFCDGERRGAIRYGITTASMHEAIELMKGDLLRKSLIYLLVFIAVCVFLYFLQLQVVQRQAESISKPIRELTNAANAIREGDYSNEIKITSNDEIGMLATNFEDMRLVVRKHTDNLEKLVEEKTEQLKETMVDLERSNKELEQFAYVASHDLQEPLRMVTSYLGLIERKYKDKLDQDGHEFIEFAVDGAVRMRQLIVDLLKYSRVGTKGKPFTNTNCEDVFENATKNLEITIEEHKAKVTHETLPTVAADEGQLVQLFQNIIGNALKFCKDRTPEVHISVRQKDNEWEFSIKDNGIGIPPENRERVFQIFQRLHTREEYEGTGIGLAVCQKIVERHGGKIWVESEIEQGTAFLFTIPFIDKEAFTPEGKEV